MPTAVDTMPVLDTARNRMYALAVTAATVPVYQYVPGDVAHVPVVVIAPVNVTPGDIRTTFDVDVELLIVGRRYDHDDAVIELEAEADRLFAAVIADGGFEFDGLAAITVSIAGTDFPAYRLSAVLTAIQPC